MAYDRSKYCVLNHMLCLFFSITYYQTKTLSTRKDPFKMKIFQHLKLLITFAVSCSLFPQVQVLANNGQLNSADYAPYVNSSYDYKASNLEWINGQLTDSYMEVGNDYRLTHLQYGPDAEGRYQFVMDDSSIGIKTFVYQIASDGVYELAYFETGNEELIDFRYHADAQDEIKSLILPSDMSLGSKFLSGYRQQNEYVVMEHYDSYLHQGQVYHDVIELRHLDNADSSWKHHVFYAPQVGIISDGFANTLIGGYSERLALTSQATSLTFDTPYAINWNEITEEITFTSNGILFNKIVLNPSQLTLSFYTESGFDGSDHLSYTANFEMDLTATHSIEVSTHTQLASQHQLPWSRSVKVNTVIHPTNISNESMAEYIDQQAPLYLYYNTSGGISLIIKTQNFGEPSYQEFIH